MLTIGGLQPISRDTAGGRTKGANEKAIVLVHQRRNVKTTYSDRSGCKQRK